MTDERSFVEQARRDKLAELEARGIPAFAYSYDRTHNATEVIESFVDGEESHVSIAGRIVSRRGHGKTTFVHVADQSGRVQVYFRRDAVGEAAYDLVKLLDLGDLIGVAGTVFRTRTGEITVHANTVTLLAKALRPPPLGKEDADGEQHGSLTDPELRYRQRYADLLAHPELKRVFEIRAGTIRFLRSFLDDRGYLEVETPVLQPLYGGALARPFTTHHNALDAPFFLRIATELYLKRCIVGGIERVYEIGRDFRNEGIDRQHNPEFTMLEFYEAYLDYEGVMALTEEMLHGLVQSLFGTSGIQRFGRDFDFTPPWPRRSYLELVEEHAGVVLDETDDEALKDLLRQRDVPDIDPLPRGRLIDEIFSEYVEPQLLGPMFVVDFPLAISPLAKPKRGNDTLAERFELYINRWEIANAFSELNDPDDQRRRFDAQQAARAAGDADAHAIDEDYHRALEFGMPPTGGCGVSNDRLVMLMADTESIRDVILFPTLRPTP
jgi:lysyl-tRNA synthetase class 2